MCERLIVVLKPVSVKLFDCPGDAAMDLPSPLLQQAIISHLLGKSMFENIFQFRVESLFIENLKPDQIGHLCPQFIPDFHNAF